jgi:hypothetical protein
VGAIGRTALLAALLATVAAAQETKRYESDGRQFSLDLPAAWEVETGGATTEVLTCDVEVAGVGKFTIDMDNLEGPALSARAQAFVERPVQLKQWKGTAARVGLQPLPHVLVDYKDGDTEYVAAYAFKRRLCRVLSVRTACSKKAWAKIGEAFLQAALTARCTLSRYPSLPEGYRSTRRDGFVYLTGKHVKAAQLKRIQKIVRETQKQFVRLHGPIERPPDEPPLVFVHAKKELARPLSKRAARSRSGHEADHRTRRLFTVPVADLHTQAHADLVFELHLLFFSEMYGEMYPSWARVGEGYALSMQAHARKKPPVVTAGWRTRFSDFAHPLDRLESIYDSDWTGYCDHSTGYALLFRYGPREYREAFRAFLDEYRATGDHEAAAKRHLFRLDQAKLMNDAREFLRRKVKVVSAG